MGRTSDLLAPAPAPAPVRCAEVVSEAGREDFVRCVYAEHGGLLLRYAARLLGGDWYRAEDVVQEAVVRAWRHAAALGARGDEVRPWLFTVVRNLVIDHHRACRVRPVEQCPLDALELSSSDGVDALLTAQAVVEALEELSEQHREMLRLTYYMGFTIAQVAERLGIAGGTAKSRSYYALRALRKALHARGIEG